MTGSKKKILVIDDTVDITKLIKISLESEGYDVVTANSGMEGIKKVLTERPDLVVLDVVMPGANGYEICARIKDEISSSLPVIMLTAQVRTIDERIGFMSKADAYIRKPESTEKLLPEIERLLKITKN